MISAVSQYIVAKMQAIDLFEAVFGLADVIRDGTKAYPAIYCGNGEYKNINNDFSSYDGLCYHRLSGEIQNTEVDSDVSCEAMRLVTYPFKIVCAMPKSKLGDNQFSDDVLASAVSVALSGKTTPLRKTLNAKVVDIIIGNKEFDNQKILQSEYEGIDLVDVDYTLSYLSVEFTVSIEIQNSCIDACESKDIINGFDWCREATYNRLTPENRQCVTDTFCGEPPKEGFAYNRPQISGQTTQFAPGDFKFLQDAGFFDFTPPPNPISFAKLDLSSPVPFRTMLDDNYHGNKDRFTDDLGGQDYVNGVVEDHRTGLMWGQAEEVQTNWPLALAASLASNKGGFNGWFMPPQKYYLSLADFSLAGSLNYPPFNNTNLGRPLWSCETAAELTTNAHVSYFDLNSVSFSFLFSNLTKTAFRFYFIVRNFS